jgi:hypothetical protein
MLDSLSVAQAVLDLYNYPSPAPIPITKWIYQSSETDSIYYGITIVDDAILVVFRGSTEFIDFIRDLEVIANPMQQGLLGPVHPGAWYQLEPILLDIFTKYSPEQVMFAGHSLGAMRATLATAWTAATFPYMKTLPRIVFGEPKSGFEKSANLANIPGSISYWNTSGCLLMVDPVYSLPFTFWPELYTHGTPPLCVEYRPDGSGPDKQWGPVAPHYMGYYLKALQASNKLALSNKTYMCLPPVLRVLK